MDPGLLISEQPSFRDFSMSYIDEFAKLFAGLDRAYTKVDVRQGVNISKGNKMETLNRCVREPLTRGIIENHINGTQCVGIYPTTQDNTACFGAIDIDQYDWSPDKRGLFLKRIADFNLPLIPCKTKSGGLHLYLFTRPSVAADVQRYLKILASMLGLTSNKNNNHVEIFPKSVKIIGANDVGSAITPPYFNAHDTTRYALDKNGAPLSFEDFILAALKLRETTDIKNLPTAKGKTTSLELLTGAPPCLETLGLSGCPEGNRNNFVYNLAVYTRMRYGTEFLPAKLEELHKETVPDPLTDKELKSIIRSVSAKSNAYFYKCDDMPICNYCNKDLCKTRVYGIGNDQLKVVNCTVENMVKILSTPPIWYADINGKRVELLTEDLTSSYQFKKTCVNQLNIIPTGMTGKRFESIITKALETCTEVPAPENASISGQIKEAFEDYLTEFDNGSRDKTSLRVGKYYYEEPYVYFKAAQFMIFLDMAGLKQVTQREVYKYLKDINDRAGGDPDCQARISIKNRQHRVWRIKQDLIPGMLESSEEFDIDDD